MIKLIASDIDGTLLDATRNISAHTIAVFRKIPVPKILISARMPNAMYYLQRDLDIINTPIICYNGALIVHKLEPLFELSIPLETLKSIAAIASDLSLHVSLYRNNEWFVSQEDQWAAREINNTRVQPTVQNLAKTLSYFEETTQLGGAHKIMYMGDKEAMDIAFAKANTLHASQVHCYRSKSTYTEITPAGTSKKVALEKLLQARYPEIGMEQIAAFGDNYNDIDMIGAVGYGVCVSNGRDALKAVASHHTGHHKEDGVANWLRENYH
jgi:hypothetical protein